MRSGSLRRRSEGSDDSWPGFVDALSTLLLVLVFLLSLFALTQFFLGNALQGRDAALARLEARVAELGDLLSLERAANSDLRETVSALSASLGTVSSERDALKSRLEAAQAEASRMREALAQARAEAEGLGAARETLEQRYRSAQEDLRRERDISARARAEIVDLESSLVALRQQLAQLTAALEASEKRDREQQATIVDLGRRLNVALAGKVAELASYRSEFFGRLKAALDQRAEIRIEGDRFIFQSELLFASGSAALEYEGREQMRRVARTLIDIAADIPEDIDWILRVDGHTDRVPISTAEFANNWELSAARAIAVVEFLISEGVPPNRLAAAGFGEFQPVAMGTDPASLARNRRIEMRFTQR
ncbi:MAG: peptidoglycan -binding protein [Rhodothalassiaceae bacterium]